MTPLTQWLGGAVLALVLGGCGLLLDAPLDDQAEADEQDRAAAHSRDFAARQVCGPKAEPQWLDDKTLVCLRRVDAATVARSTL